jgi:hypothetical protein
MAGFRDRPPGRQRPSGRRKLPADPGIPVDQSSGGMLEAGPGTHWSEDGQPKVFSR